MSIFHNKEQNGLPFDKEDIKNEILERVPVELPEWKIIPFPIELIFQYNSPLSSVPDFLGIRNIEVDKEIKITSNPFSHYKRIEPTIYQIVAVIYISEDKFSLNEGSREMEVFHFWRVITASSYDMLVRKLREEN